MSTILIYSLVNFLGAIFFLFNFWRFTKHDNVSEEIFPLGLRYIFVLIITSLLTPWLARFLPDSGIYNKNQLWFVTSSIAFAFMFFMDKNFFRKGQFYDVLNVEGMGLLGWLGFISLGYAIDKFNQISLVPVLFILLLFIIHNVVEFKYKTFTWYKSGKSGLSGVLTLAIFFVARTLFSFVGSDIISFAGRIELIFSGVIAFLMLFSVYQLSLKS